MLTRSLFRTQTCQIETVFPRGKIIFIVLAEIRAYAVTRGGHLKGK